MSFANTFWSGDYAGGMEMSAHEHRMMSLTPELGLGVLFGKLQQGVQENQQVLTIARLRADAEEVYGAKLGSITASTDSIPGGFQRDEGASVRKVRVKSSAIGTCR